MSCSRSVRRQLQQVREDACRFAARRLLGFTDLDKLVDIDNFRVVPSQLQSTLATLTECRRFWFPSRRALWLSLCLSAGFRPAAEAQPPIGSVFARGVHGCAYEQHCWQGSSWHSWRIIHKGQVAECVPNSTSGSSRTAHKKKKQQESRIVQRSLQLTHAHSNWQMLIALFACVRRHAQYP